MRRTLNKTFLTHLPVAASTASRVDTTAAGASAVCIYVSVTLLFDCGCKLLSVPNVFLFDSQK